MKNLLLLAFFLGVSILKAQEPKFLWAKSFGGNTDIHVNSIKTDATGNIYILGTFTGTVDFDPNIGTNNLTAIGSFENLFIAKYNDSGNLIWARSLLIFSEYIYSFSVDEKGEAFITCNFAGIMDFDPGVGIYNLSSNGFYNIFILKLNSDGNFVWAKNMGGVRDNAGFSIALDGLGNIYTTGIFVGTADFDPGSGVFNLTASSNMREIFISKINAEGNFVWAKNLAGTSFGFPLSIAVDVFGNVYSTGVFRDTVDFDPGVGVYPLTADGLYDNIYVLKLNAAGNFVWAKKMKGSNRGSAFSIAVSNLGNPFISGSFEGTLDFNSNQGIQNLNSKGKSDIFIAALDLNGNFIWVKTIGGKGSDGGNSLNADINGDIYCTGSFTDSVDFDPGVGVYRLNAGLYTSIFMLKLNSVGNFEWARTIEKTGSDFRFFSALDGLGNIYSTGYFSGTTNFNTDNGILNLTSSGWGDIFIHKMSQPGFIDKKDKGGDIIAFPNPSSTGKFKIAITALEMNTNIEVYSELGSLVLVKDISNKVNLIDLSEEANGIYFIKIMQNGKQLAQKKIIKTN